MKKQIAIIATGFALLFSGCATSSSIGPKLGEDNKSIYIGDYKLENIKFVSDRRIFRGKETNYASTDKLSYIKHISQTINNNGYWHELNDMMNKNGIVTCKYTKIDTVKFFECENKKLKLNEYIINQVTNSFKTQDTMYVDKELFNDVKSHFEEKAKKDKTKILVDEVGRKEFSEKSILYFGTYNILNPTNKDCKIQNGNVSLVSYDNEVYGYSGHVGSSYPMRIIGKKKGNTFMFNMLYTRKELTINGNKISGVVDYNNCKLDINIEEVESFNSSIFNKKSLTFGKYKYR